MRIVFCLPGKTFSNEFLMSWSGLLEICHQMNIGVVLSNNTSSNIFQNRSCCLAMDLSKGKRQKPFCGLQYDYIMWIDSDVIFKPEHFKKLLSRNVDIVTGLYLQENPRIDDNGNLYAVFAASDSWKPNTVKQNTILTWNKIKDKKDPFEIVYAGMGFMLIKCGVFESIDIPWFPSIANHLDEWGTDDMTSEDVGFCLKAREYGFKIWADPSVIVGHEKSRILLPNELINKE